MPSLGDLLKRKDPTVHTIPVNDTVLQAVCYMNEHQIGGVVVVKGEEVVGMFTERDVLRRVVAEERRPADIPVAEVMSHEVICAGVDTPVEEASRIMKDRRIRHLPICRSDGKLVGLISIGDINAYFASDQEATIHFLHDYLYGRA